MLIYFLETGQSPSLKKSPETNYEPALEQDILIRQTTPHYKLLDTQSKFLTARFKAKINFRIQ